MKRFINIISAGLITVSAFAGVLTTSAVLNPTVASAASVDEVREGVNKVGGNKSGNSAGAFSNLLENVINLLLFIIGAIAVIMIIIGGIRYTTSAGDANQAKSARDTVLYSVVGLVIAIMAYAIVNFVLKSLD